MTIQVLKRQKGTVYRYRFTLKGITVCSETYSDKEQCKRDEAKARAQILEGTYIVTNKQTVGEVWKMYCEYKPVRPSSQKNRDSIFNNFAVNGIADMPINKITTLHIDRYAKQLKESGYTIATIQNRIATISALFRWAYSKKLIPANPAFGVDSVPKSKKKKKVAIFSKEEFMYRLAVIKEKYPHLYGVAILGGLFGLRAGEMCAININGNFDYNKKVLKLTHQYGYLGTSSPHYGEPKSDDSSRDIPILNFAIPFIEENIAYVRKRAFMGELRLRNGDDQIPFCVSERGKRYTTPTLDYAWRVMNKKENWQHLSPHKLRHTYATLCRDAQVPLETISDMLGHADVRTTKAIYAHKTFVQLDSAATKLDTLFNEE